MPRRFNTAGPCLFEDHYMLPPEERLPQVRELIDGKHYFVIHAPRQTGKTTLIRNLSRKLTAEGKYAALTISLESFVTAEPESVMPQLLKGLWSDAEYAFPADLQPPKVDEFVGDPLIALREYLSAWSDAIRLPVVLFLDEADSLAGPVLISLLRQLRDGYTARPRPFPQSVALVGLKDIRDYRIQVRSETETLGTSSPFNIKVESLTMGNFSREEVARLLRQHTEEAGQPFEPDAMDEVFHQTGGQPWLVNALASQLTTHYNAFVKDRGIPVTRDHVLAAKEILVERRDTHLDSLVHRLREPRIKRVIEPIMVGEVVADATYDDDFSYTKDLGLVTAADGGPRRIANPIYAEIIARVLIHQVQTSIPEDPAWFVRGDGTLDMMKLIAGFLEFWRENGEVLLRGLPYQEAAPHLVFMGYLQRIVNGGRVEREFALGTRQVAEYAKRLGLRKGYLLLFDREATTPWEERGEIEEIETHGVTVVVVRV